MGCGPDGHPVNVMGTSSPYYINPCQDSMVNELVVNQHLTTNPKVVGYQTITNCQSNQKHLVFDLWDDNTCSCKNAISGQTPNMEGCSWCGSGTTGDGQQQTLKAGHCWLPYYCVSGNLEDDKKCIAFNKDVIGQWDGKGNVDVGGARVELSGKGAG